MVPTMLLSTLPICLMSKKKGDGMQFMVVNMMMTVPTLIFLADGEVFLDVVSTKPFSVSYF